MPLFVLSTTRDPAEQGLRTLRVLVSFWQSESSSDVTYGYLVGYAGGGTQGFGGFKYIRSGGVFFFKQFCDSSAEERSADGWDHVVGDGDPDWTADDEQALGGANESMVFDELEAEGPDDDGYDTFIGGGTVLPPSTLQAMTAGYGDGHFVLWQGEPDDELLARLSLHWPLLTTFNADGVHNSRGLDPDPVDAA